MDGELVGLDDSGRPDFNLLQNFRGEASRIHYYIFDLLACKDRDLTRLPLIWTGVARQNRDEYSHQTSLSKRKEF